MAKNYDRINSTYIAEKMQQTEWENRQYIDDLAKGHSVDFNQHHYNILSIQLDELSDVTDFLKDVYGGS